MPHPSSHDPAVSGIGPGHPDFLAEIPLPPDDMEERYDDELSFGFDSFDYAPPAPEHDPHADPDDIPLEMPEIPGSPTIEHARAILKKYWGYDDFRPGQAECIEAALKGRDTVGILPTGAGKSVVYQISGLLMPGVTLIISPLISLMKDQIDALRRKRLPATFINSTLTPTEMERRMLKVEQGAIKLLYVSPERLDSLTFRERIKNIPVMLVAVDEAHCLSEWGHDFRPAYMRIRSHREKLFPLAQVLALTATATPEVRDDIVDHLGLDSPLVHVGGFDRPNLSWRSLHIDVNNRALAHQVKCDTIMRELRNMGDGSAVIYTGTRKETDAIASWLRDMQHDAIAYHGGQTSHDRRDVQDVFMSGNAKIVVATNAFGMGVDKSNVRKVIHYQIPGTIEAYYQEAGRAGRDGDPSQCILLYFRGDTELHENFISMSHPHKEWYAYVYRAISKYADENGNVVHQNRDGTPRRSKTGEVDHMTRSDLIRAEQWPDFNPVSAILNAFHEAGVIDYTGGSASGVYVRINAAPEEIAKILDAPRCREDHRLTMRELWRLAGGQRLFQGVMLRERVLEQFQGEAAQLKKTLRFMEKKGALVWENQGTRIRLLRVGLNPNRLPLPWDEIARRRALEYQKLERVVEYAVNKNCRRGDLLNYFGDPEAMEHCGSCDNCRARAATAA